MSNQIASSPRLESVSVDTGLWMGDFVPVCGGLSGVYDGEWEFGTGIEGEIRAENGRKSGRKNDEECDLCGCVGAHYCTGKPFSDPASMYFYEDDPQLEAKNFYGVKTEELGT